PGKKPIRNQLSVDGIVIDRQMKGVPFPESFTVEKFTNMENGMITGSPPSPELPTRSESCRFQLQDERRKSVLDRFEYARRHARGEGSRVSEQRSQNRRAHHGRCVLALRHRDQTGNRDDSSAMSGC